MNKNQGSHSYQAVAIGASAGGLSALKKVIQRLPASFPLPIFIVQHISPSSDDFLSHFLKKSGSLDSQIVFHGTPIHSGTIYCAPPGYHLLIETDKTLSLSIDPHVLFSRPSIDVMFESAAEVYRSHLIGVLLTGANRDGSQGLVTIKKHGGLILAQDPSTAEYPAMPQSAVDTGIVDHVLDLPSLGEMLSTLALPS